MATLEAGLSEEAVTAGCPYCNADPATADAECEGISALISRSHRDDKRTPMTLLSGFLGAGKTTLLENILRNRVGIKVAVIVNDLGSVNVDGQAVKKLGLDEQDDKVVELSNGCMCCGLKDDLLKEIADIAKSGKFDVLLVEGSGVAEPMPVAEGISNYDVGRGKTLADIVHLDTIVTVVDTPNFLENYNSQQSISERPDLAGPDTGGHTPVVSLMVEQIEFANVILLNKQSEVSKEDLTSAEGIIASLNPGAKVFKTNFSQVCPTNVLCTDLFDFDSAEDMPGWAKLQQPGWVSKVSSCNVKHQLYQRDKPFHPGRLGMLISDGHVSTVPRQLGLTRSKGIFWIATRSEFVGEWQHAGSLYRFVQGHQWDNGPQTLVGKESRRQELVLIGPGLDTAALEAELDKCLLTDDEMLLKHPRTSPRLSAQSHDHGHGAAQVAASVAEVAPAADDHAHAHGHGHGQAQAQAHHDHHHGHGHDSDGNCMGEVDPELEPWKWWRSLCKDQFPPFEVDCCANDANCDEHDQSGHSARTLKSAVAKDLRTRGQLATEAQEALADATAQGDLSKMVELLEAGVAKVNSTSVVNLGDDSDDSESDDDEEAEAGGDDEEEEEEEAESEAHMWTALHIAAQVHSLKAATLLLDRGANPNFTAYTKKALTPLMVAVMSSAEDADIVKLLVRHGANVNDVGPDGATALHFACDLGYEKCGVALIKAGCATHIKDDEGQTAQKVAISHENRSLVMTLAGAVEAYEKSKTKRGQKRA